MTPRRSALLAGIVGLAAAVVAAVALTVGNSSTRIDALVGGGTVSLAPADRAPPAPELAGITHFLNTEPVTMAQLRGRVVLVDFWTYTCINCRRTFPFLRALSATYAEQGLTVLGVHSPEFPFERDPANVARAVSDLHVTWPVAEDPQLATWDAYDNQYWPTSYLVDRAGRVRYVHIGEGGDTAIEQAVRALLDEGGTAGARTVGPVGDPERAPSEADAVTPESYFGAQRGAKHLAGHAAIPPGTTTVRHDGARGGALDRDLIYLSGAFTGGDQSVSTAAPGATVRLRFHARDLYLTAAPSPGRGPIEVGVLLDGKPVPAAQRGPDLRVTRQGATVLTVADDDLAHLLTAPAVRDGVLTLSVPKAGLQLFTFTFGG